MQIRSASRGMPKRQRKATPRPRRGPSASTPFRMAVTGAALSPVISAACLTKPLTVMVPVTGAVSRRAATRLGRPMGRTAWPVALEERSLKKMVSTPANRASQGKVRMTEWKAYRNTSGLYWCSSDHSRAEQARPMLACPLSDSILTEGRLTWARNSSEILPSKQNTMFHPLLLSARAKWRRNFPGPPLFSVPDQGRKKGWDGRKTRPA